MGKWYEDLTVVGQINLSELNAKDCDLSFWEKYWEETGTNGIVLNAGGIVSYYPSKVEGQKQARFLNDRDLVGEFVEAAKRHNISVIARMDCGVIEMDVAEKHPEWVARKENGEMYVSQGRAQCCVNSSYYKEHIPEVLTEICERYHPAGFSDNSWTGLPRTKICYCDSCKKKFKDYRGHDLPTVISYDDEIYREWIRWSYTCRIENWDLFNETVRKAGGEDTIWSGMVNANFVSGHVAFCDLRDLADRAELLMVDHQSRDGNGFEQNSFNGLLLHQLTKWKPRIFQSMATYVRGKQAFRHSANPSLEMRLWMTEGFAGGILPWWHIIGARQDDRRIYELPKKSLEFYRENVDFITDRKPLANVGILWSQENVEFYGRDRREERLEMALRGVTRALTRAGISFLPVHLSDIDEQAKEMKVLILPEVFVLSDEQKEALLRFKNRGGNLLFIGRSGMMNEKGEMRETCITEDLTGVHFKSHGFTASEYNSSWEVSNMHNYQLITKKDHPIFKNFEDTDILPLGAEHFEAELLNGATCLAGYIPPYPIFPPEFSWRELPENPLPSAVEMIHENGSKVISYLWALDVSYGELAVPDLGDELSNTVLYLLDEKPAVRVKADGYVDLTAYKKDDDIIIHLINLNVQDFAPGYAEHLFKLSDVKLELTLSKDAIYSAELLEGESEILVDNQEKKCEITLKTLNEQALILLKKA